MSLDEHRARFKPNFWNRLTPAQLQLGTQKGDMPKSRPKPHRQKTLKQLERQYTDGGDHLTDVEEVWFSGCHCGKKHSQSLQTIPLSYPCADVGGGAVANETRNSLARIPLRWMVRQCFLLNIGILFHRETFKLIGMDPSTIYPIVQPRPSPLTMFPTTPRPGQVPLPSMGTGRTLVDANDFISEEDEDLADALSPINDMLQIAKSWWLLEVIPQKQRFQRDDNSWSRKISYVTRTFSA